MQKNSLLLFIGVLFITSIYSQKKNEVLLTIDETPIHTSEFERVYLKNIDLIKDESQKNIDDYLTLFINYKLKLKEAKTLGLDKKESYLKELEGYKKQLSAGYLTDTNASDALVKEAYDRIQQRVHASHILIKASPEASPKDSLAAYEKIIDLRNQVKNGTDFNEIAKKYSEDPSAKENGGDLGWFSAFRMVYPFEDAAFKTNVGDVSEPFRTRFGFHILQVHKKEKTLGEITVAHIMIAFNNGVTEEEAEEKINDIYKQVVKKVPFESLAKQYSNDRNTAENGGKITRFGQGALNSDEFEKAAFGLKTSGDVSQPVKSKYGWHIIKLIEKHATKPLEELREELTQKIKRDSRSQKISKSFLNSLKEKYQISKNEEAIAYFKNIVTDSVFKGRWKMSDTDRNADKIIMKFDKGSFTYKDFASYLTKKGTEAENPDTVSTFIEKMYEAYESETLLNYYEEHLEEDNEDFANIMSEYRDGLLLFDLMETKIWNAAKTDSVGLLKYYEDHKNSYVQNDSYKILKASSSDQDAILMVKTLLEKETSLEEIKKAVNPADEVVVIFSNNEELEKGKDAVTEKFSGEKNQILVTDEDGYYTLIKIKEVVPSRIKTYKEIKGKVVNDFQDNLEKSWLLGLKEKYQVKINKKALKNVKKKLNK